MNTRTRFFAVVAAPLFATAAHAQVAPVTAQATETTQVVSGLSAGAGAATTHTRTGNYFRRADGSTLTQWLSADGDTSHPVALLSIPSANVTYQLDLTNNTGTKLGGVGEPVIVPKQTSPHNLPHSTIAGIPCTIYPVRPKNPAAAGPTAPTGQTCISDQYGLVLERDLTYVGQDAQTRHEHYQLTAIQLNAPPAAALFDLSAFTIQ